MMKSQLEHLKEMEQYIMERSPDSQYLTHLRRQIRAMERETLEDQSLYQKWIAQVGEQMA